MNKSIFKWLTLEHKINYNSLKNFLYDISQD